MRRKALACTVRLSAGSPRLMSSCVQVFGCRNDETIHALGRPASEKRQGTKSRWVGQRRCGGRYGDLAAARRLEEVDEAATASCLLQTMDGRVGVNERSGTLHDGIWRRERANPADATRVVAAG